MSPYFNDMVNTLSIGQLPDALPPLRHLDVINEIICSKRTDSLQFLITRGRGDDPRAEHFAELQSKDRHAPGTKNQN
ncbi:hypothetical protein D3C81_1812480 [compost metagenome]